MCKAKLAVFTVEQHYVKSVMVVFITKDKLIARIGLIILGEHLFLGHFAAVVDCFQLVTHQAVVCIAV